MFFLTVSSLLLFTTLPRAIKSLRSIPARKAFTLPERIITRQSGSLPNTLNAFYLEFTNVLSSLFIFFFREIGEAFNLLGKDPDCRVIILSGNGKAFCAGIDLNDLMALGSVVNDDELDTARKSIKLLTVIKKFQGHHMEIEKVESS